MGFDKIIYSLSHPITKEVVYIGITQDITKRVYSHYNAPSKLLKPFIDDLKANDLYPVITEIDKGDNRLEAFYIKKFIELGSKLLNKNSVVDFREQQKQKAIIKAEAKWKYAEDDIYNEWMAKFSRGDIKLIASKTGYTGENIRLCFASRKMRTEIYDAIVAYYNEIPQPFIPEPIIKICRFCNESKPVEAFKQLRSEFCTDCLKNKAVEIKRLRANEWHKRTNNASQKKWNEKNKEKIAKYQKEYHSKYKHPDPEKRQEQISNGNSIDNNSYIKRILKQAGYTDEQITPEVIELKRLQLEIKKKLNNKAA